MKNTGMDQLHLEIWH